MAVRLAAFKRARADLELAAAIEVARAATVSWRAIGETIGISGDAARQRYSRQQGTLSSVGFLRSIAEGALAEALARREAAPKGIRSSDAPQSP
jgi:hypothetical protein